MSNVQQPEMRRSGQDPLVTDSVKDKARRTGPAKSDRARGRVPEDQKSSYGPRRGGRQESGEPTTRYASKRKAQPGTPGPS